MTLPCCWPFLLVPDARNRTFGDDIDHGQGGPGHDRSCAYSHPALFLYMANRALYDHHSHMTSERFSMSFCW
jgi:hypothetical protein